MILFGLAITVTVATEPAEYEFEVTQLIQSPKNVVFNYVNDYKNWSSWNVVPSSTTYQLGTKSAGIGSQLRWSDAEDEITHTNLELTQNSFIRQKMFFNGSVSEWKWDFKATKKGTRISLKIKGEAPFMFKVVSSFHGGVQEVLKSRASKSLEFLDKTLDYELNTFSIQSNGFVTKIGCNYLCQNITSKFVNLPRNIKILIPKLMQFVKSNQIEPSGAPFILYHSLDSLKGITNVSVCVPVKEEMFTSPGSEITGGVLETFQAAKTTLKGDYSHLNATWKKTSNYIQQQNRKRAVRIPILELYTKNSFNEKHPSQWVTQLYVPIEFHATNKNNINHVTNQSDSLLINRTVVKPIQNSVVQ